MTAHLPVVLALLAATLVPVATVGIPTLCMVLLLLLPFYDRNPERLPWRRPVATTAGIMTIIAALARSAGGKARNSIAMPTGVSIPPPTPWSTRNRISCPIEDDIEHSNEPRVNAARANRKIRFVPNRSPSQPDAGIHTARLTV